MKSYERFLGSAWEVVRIVLIIGIFCSVAGFILIVLNSGDNQREAERAGRLEMAAWCLSVRGRTVTIDNVNGCFKLTSVADSLFDTSMWADNRCAQCLKRADAVWIKVRGGIKSCFHFEQLTRPDVVTSEGI